MMINSDFDHRRSFVLRLNKAIRPLEDAAQIQATACDMLSKEMRADRSGYAELSALTGSITVLKDAASDVPSLMGKYQTADFETQLCDRLRCGEVDVHCDVAADPALTSAEKQLMPRCR